MNTINNNKVLSAIVKMISTPLNTVYISAISCTFLVFLAGSVMAAPPDAKEDGTGWCDGQDPSSSLYSICIQAHSAMNRVEHLEGKNASANAVAKAHAAFAEAKAQYAELGGGALPGFVTCPCATLPPNEGISWQVPQPSFRYVTTVTTIDSITAKFEDGDVLGGITEYYMDAHIDDGFFTCGYGSGRRVLEQVFLMSNDQYAECVSDIGELNSTF